MGPFEACMHVEGQSEIVSLVLHLAWFSDAP